MKPKKRRRILPLLLLALVCVGAAELLACRVFDPQLYDRICAPVRSAWQSATALVDRTASDLSAYQDQIGESLADVFLTLAAAAAQPSEDLCANAPAKGSGEISDPATELSNRDGVQVLTGGSLDTIYYNQVDPAWASGSYGSDPIDGYGCGPTAMAIVVSSLTDRRVDPLEMSQWAVEQKHWAPGSGSYLSIVPAAAAAFGLSAQPFPIDDPDALSLALSTGHMLVALMAPGHFTNSGHFIVLRGITLDGKILVADPSSSERSLTGWDAQLILDELSSSRTDGAPLWLIQSYDEPL